MSEKIWLICRVMSSSVSSSPGRLAWGTGLVGAIVEDRRTVTWDSLSGFLSKIDETVAMSGGWGPCSGCCSPDVKIGTSVEIF